MIDQINQILNDPGSMEQIMKMASSLSIEAGEDKSPEISSIIPADITATLHQVQEKEEKQQALVRALLPYLRPGHQKRLERAVQIARLSHLAGAAWKNGTRSAANEEVDNDV